MKGRLACQLSRSHQLLFPLNTVSCRYESSYRRNRSRLNVKPDPSFLFTFDSPQRDHIIFNPPESARSVFQTPLKFIPPTDKRRELLAATDDRLGIRQTKLPPPMRPKEVNILRGHLNLADIKEIQRLNNRDPDTWTNRKLARKFNCSPEFVSVCLRHAGGDPTARKAAMKAKWDQIESRWGPRRKKAREDRQKRWDAALRGE